MENYENELKTIGSQKYPVQATVQALVDDHLYGLSFYRRLGVAAVNIVCFVFKAHPRVPPVTAQDIDVVL